MALQNHPMWRKPQHHHEIDDAHDHVHWVELFYDLIHVVTIFLLGNYLSHHHVSWEGLLVFAGVFTALWLAWGELSVFNSIYVSTDVWHRIAMALMICTVMFMAASIPSITGKAWPYFALGFAVNRLLLASFYHRARRIGTDTNTMCSEMVRNMCVTASLFAVSAFLPRPLAFWVFGIGVVMTQLVYMIPAISPLRFDRYRPRVGHMAERFALLTLIVLGEGFFKLVITLSEKGIYKVSPDVLFNFVLGGIATFVMCWIYFDLVGNAKPKDSRSGTLVKWWLGHLVLMMCAVMVGVALAGEVKVGFFDSFPLDYARAGCFGLAGYLAALWLIQSVVEPREAHRFARADIRLFGIGMALATYVIVPYVPALIGNLFWGTALFSQIVVPLWRAASTYNAEDALKATSKVDT